MMNRSVQHGCIPDGTPDFDELKKLTEECSKGQVRGQEITKIREIHSRQDKRARSGQSDLWRVLSAIGGRGA